MYAIIEESQSPIYIQPPPAGLVGQVVVLDIRTQCFGEKWRLLLY